MNSYFENQKTKWYLVGITVLGLVVRIARCIVDLDIKQDAVLYMNMAQLWSEKGVDAAYSFMTWIPPLWPWLLGLGYSCGIEPDVSAQVLGVLFGASVCLSVFVIGRTIFKNESYALVSALLVAVHPYLIRISTEMLRGSLYIPLVAIAVAVAVRASMNYKRWKWLIYGAICGLAVMTRREGGELMLFLACWSLIELVRGRSEFVSSCKRLFVVNGCAYAGFIIVALPVQVAMCNTVCTWRIIPQGITGTITGIFSGTEEELLKTLQEKK